MVYDPCRPVTAFHSRATCSAPTTPVSSASRSSMSSAYNAGRSVRPGSLAYQVTLGRLKGLDQPHACQFRAEDAADLVNPLPGLNDTLARCSRDRSSGYASVRRPARLAVDNVLFYATGRRSPGVCQLQGIFTGVLRIPLADDQLPTPTTTCGLGSSASGVEYAYHARTGPCRAEYLYHRLARLIGDTKACLPFRPLAGRLLPRHFDPEHPRRPKVGLSYQASAARSSPGTECFLLPDKLKSPGIGRGFFVGEV